MIVVAIELTLRSSYTIHDCGATGRTKTSRSGEKNAEWVNSLMKPKATVLHFLVTIQSACTQLRPSEIEYVQRQGLINSYVEAEDLGIHVMEIASVEERDEKHSCPVLSYGLRE